MLNHGMLFPQAPWNTFKMPKLREMQRSALEDRLLTLPRREDLPSGGASQPQPTPIPAQKHLQVAEPDL